MALKYKFDILQRLKQAGYSSYRIRQDGLLNESTLTKFRAGDTNVTLKNIHILCKLLDCQPGDILEYVPDGDILKD